VQTALDALTQAARHDLSCACGPSQPRQRGSDGLWIYPAALPSGQRVPMLKVLQASGCERSCIYCVERCGGQGRSVALRPEQLASAFVDLHRQGRVFGLFLSSAIQGTAAATMDRMLGTVELLRRRHRFRGYIHLKMIPGCRPDQIDRAMQLATRLSVNMEAPTAAHLARIAPGKKFDSRDPGPHAAGQSRHRRRPLCALGTDHPAGGGSGRRGGSRGGARGCLGLRRNGAGAGLLFGDAARARNASRGSAAGAFGREHRLYQVDFLLRSYGFSVDEIEFDAAGALPLDVDPKTAWARRHPERFPVEINTAARGDLLRVPGIGPSAAKRLEQMRREHRLRDIAALRAAGASWKVASPFVLLDGKPAERQMSLWQ
jgi:predicted DNA-binding helix-hairpin-helix protein